MGIPPLDETTRAVVPLIVSRGGGRRQGHLVFSFGTGIAPYSTVQLETGLFFFGKETGPRTTQEETSAMFEVIVTYRSGFREESIGRFSSDEEAQDCARRLAANNPEVIIRAWVRVIREAKSKS